MLLILISSNFEYSKNILAFLSSIATSSGLASVTVTSESRFPLRLMRMKTDNDSGMSVMPAEKRKTAPGNVSAVA